jgi:hypothetical protein
LAAVEGGGFGMLLLQPRSGYAFGYAVTGRLRYKAGWVD